MIAPDPESLLKRWDKLIHAAPSQKEDLFHPTLRDGVPADRHINSVVRETIPGYEPILTRIADEEGPCLVPVPYSFRSFNRQWIIPDARVITQPNAELWASRSQRQVYLTALSRSSPKSGPAATFSGLVPDLDHYKGSFGGRVFPLWKDKDATIDNFRPQLRSVLSGKWGHSASADDLIAYIAAVLASPAFTSRFKRDLSTPGLRVPLTADWSTFVETAQIGRRVIWLHTFGERMADAKEGRPPEPPRFPADRRPLIPHGGAIPSGEDQMPDSLQYNAAKHRLHVGLGYIDNVTPAMWFYDVSGKQVLNQWFSYRKKNRERPIIGERRTPSSLGNVQPDHWLPEYTTELLNLLNVLGLLVELEPQQAELLNKLCAGPLISNVELESAGAFTLPPKPKKSKKKAGTIHMFAGGVHAETHE